MPVLIVLTINNKMKPELLQKEMSGLIVQPMRQTMNPQLLEQGVQPLIVIPIKYTTTPPRRWQKLETKKIKVKERERQPKKVAVHRMSNKLPSKTLIRPRLRPHCLLQKEPLLRSWLASIRPRSLRSRER